jgi:hypothetical protein
MQPQVQQVLPLDLLQENMQKVYSVFQDQELEIPFQQCLLQEKLLFKKRIQISMDHFLKQLEMTLFQDMQLE